MTLGLVSMNGCRWFYYFFIKFYFFNFMNKKFVRKLGKNANKLMMALAVVATGGVAFVLGVMMSSAWQQAPMVVEHSEVQIITNTASAQILPTNSTQTISINATLENAQKTCAFVGSKNSTKYYPPTCSHAKRVSPKNLRCFVTEGDAISAGYTRSVTCK